MEKIPTAEEFFELDNGLYTAYSVKNKEGEFTPVCSYDKAIEFAKIHVEAALKAASEKGEAFVRTNGEWTSSKVTAGVNKESIINSYSLYKIK